jgi:hypothetical protein
MLLVLVLLTAALHAAAVHTEDIVSASRAHAASCLRGHGLEDDELVETLLKRASEAESGNLTARPFVFTHIPKNGGSTMTALLKASWAQAGCASWQAQNPDILPAVRKFNSQCVANNSQCVPTATGTALGLTPGAACYYLHLYSGQSGFPIEALRLALPIFGHEGVGALRYVVGHVMYGACDFLQEGCTHSTVLREPVSRFLSHMWWECRPDSSVRHRHGESCHSIAAFAQAVVARRDEQPYLNFHNHQTRMISGDSFFNSMNDGFPCHFASSGCDLRKSSKLSRADLRTAITNPIERTPVWGHMEYLGDFMRRLSSVYGVEFPTHHLVNPPKYNKAGRGRRLSTNPKQQDLDPETRKSVEVAVNLDLELYNLSS